MRSAGLLSHILLLTIILAVAGCTLPPSTALPSETAVTPTLLSGSATPAGTAVQPEPSRTCAEIAPFAPNCLAQERPAGLSSAVTFIGILPAQSIHELAWNPDGTLLAYSAQNQTPRRTIGVRAPPNWVLRQTWAPPGPVYNLTWAPDGQQMAFTLDAGKLLGHVWLVQLGKPDGQELDPGDAAWKLLGIQWLDGSSLLLTSGCGTSCYKTYTLRISDGVVDRLRNLWENLPDKEVVGSNVAFDPKRQWFTARDYVYGFPRTVLVKWDNLDDSTPLATELNTRFTSAESWSGSTLAFLSYPSGNAGTWILPLYPELHAWDLQSGQKRLVGRGVFLARFSPQGDRLAAFFIGLPQMQADGTVQSVGTQFYVGLLDWPSGELLTYYPLGGEGCKSVWDVFDFFAPRWSLDGELLAFELADGALALMDHDGQVEQVLSGRRLGWEDPHPGFAELPAYWGADRYLAILVEEQVWIVRATEE